MKRSIFLSLWFSIACCAPVGSPLPTETPIPGADSFRLPVPMPVAGTPKAVLKVPPEVERLNNAVKETGQKVIDVTRQVLKPERPQADHQIPKVRIISDPANILSLTTIKVPSTVRFEAIVDNESKTGGIKNYAWKVEKLGVPFFDKDNTIHTANEGKTLLFTFQTSGRFRVTGTVTNRFEETGSDSVSLWARP